MPMSAYVADTGKPFKFALSYSDGSHPNITGYSNSNFTLHLYNSPTTKVCTGNFSVQDGVDGVVWYWPLSTDVDTAGTWTPYLTVQLPSGPVTWSGDTITVTQKF